MTSPVLGEFLGTMIIVLLGDGVVAGVLLLINIFVMLAEERKSELGMLRALGLKRNHLVRAFGLEGSMYALTAAVVGAAAGAVHERGRGPVGEPVGAVRGAPGREPGVQAVRR